MPLFALGINHQCASISQREQLAFTSGEAPSIIQALRRERAVEEAVVLSTCNRTEIYTVTRCHHAVKAWLRKLRSDASGLFDKMYEHHDVDMIKHLMSVASGIDSMVLGEPQILGQMKQSYQLAETHGAIGHQFRHLFPSVFEAAKQVRTETKVGAHPVTLTYAVMQLAKQIFPTLSQCRILLIGVGETSELMASYLQRHEPCEIIVANRTFERAQTFAQQYANVRAIHFDEIASVLSDVDIVVSATAAEEPILHKSDVEAALAGVKGQPKVFADLAVPRDIASDVAELDGVVLYNIDHLQAVIAENQATRAQAAVQARGIIEGRALHYQRQLRVLDAGDMIRTFRQKMELIRDSELGNALKKLEKGQDPAAVTMELARALTNKFMHEPTTKLRDAAYAEHEPLMGLLKELYEL